MVGHSDLEVMMKIALVIEVEITEPDPELNDKILGRIYTLDGVEDVRLLFASQQEPKQEKY
jgi:hypothetical protein